MQFDVEDFEDFRRIARLLWARAAAPEAVVLRAAPEGGGMAQVRLEVGSAAEAAGPAVHVAPLHVPAPLLAALRDVAHHSDPGRWQLLWRLVWRQQQLGGGALAQRRLDPDVVRLERLRQQVRRDVHRCHAFLRFRAHADAEGEVWGAWYEPDHDIFPLALEFFVARLGETRWWVASRRRSAAFDGQRLRWLPGRRPERAAAAGVAPEGEAEALWRTYFSAIFDPARTNPKAMRQHMPARILRHLPEAACVPILLREARSQQEDVMRSTPSGVR